MIGRSWKQLLGVGAGLWFGWIMVRYITFLYANIWLFLQKAPGVERVLSGLRAFIGG